MKKYLAVFSANIFSHVLMEIQLCNASDFQNFYVYDIFFLYSASSEQPARVRKGQCEVVWIVEADLAYNEHLYVTGDPSALGSWDPDCAILMYPTGNDNEWEAKVKVMVIHSFVSF